MCPVHQGASRYQLTLFLGCGATQCYVIAAAQKGRHNEKRESYGHALVIDPWGVVVAQCSQVCASMPLVGGLACSYQLTAVRATRGANRPSRLRRWTRSTCPRCESACP